MSLQQQLQQQQQQQRQLQLLKCLLEQREWRIMKKLIWLPLPSALKSMQ